MKLFCSSSWSIWATCKQELVFGVLDGLFFVTQQWAMTFSHGLLPTTIVSYVSECVSLPWPGWLSDSQHFRMKGASLPIYFCSQMASCKRLANDNLTISLMNGTQCCLTAEKDIIAQPQISFRTLLVVAIHAEVLWQVPYQ